MQERVSVRALTASNQDDRNTRHNDSDEALLLVLGEVASNLKHIYRPFRIQPDTVVLQPVPLVLCRAVVTGHDLLRRH